MKKKSKVRKTKQVFTTQEVRPGHVVINTSTATGGVSHRREHRDRTKTRGGGEKVEIYTVKVVDHAEAVRAIDALIKRTDYACRKICARTAFGLFADDVGLKILYQEFEALRKEADELNGVAEAVGSARRAYVSVVAARLELATPHATREIARTIRTVLTDVRDALASGHVKTKKSPRGKILVRDDLHAPLLRAKNLDKLAVGVPGETLNLALDRIPEAKREILDMLAEGIAPEDAGQRVDLSLIDAAIGWFEEIRHVDVYKGDAVARALAE